MTELKNNGIVIFNSSNEYDLQIAKELINRGISKHEILYHLQAVKTIMYGTQNELNLVVDFVVKNIQDLYHLTMEEIIKKYRGEIE